MFFNGLAECDEDILPLCTVYVKLNCLGGCGSKVLGLAIIHLICCWPEIMHVEAIFLAELIQGEFTVARVRLIQRAQRIPHAFPVAH